jgi:hypothetical protein
MSALPHPAEHRRDKRYDVELDGVAVFPGGSTTIRVLDISYGGARIELPLHASLYSEQTIQALRIAQILQMRVNWRWSRDRQLGVEFVAPDLARGAIARLIQISTAADFRSGD